MIPTIITPPLLIDTNPQAIMRAREGIADRGVETTNQKPTSINPTLTWLTQAGQGKGSLPEWAPLWITQEETRQGMSNLNWKLPLLITDTTKRRLIAEKRRKEATAQSRGHLPGGRNRQDHLREAEMMKAWMMEVREALKAEVEERMQDISSTKLDPR